MISSSDLAKWLDLNIRKTKTALRKPKLQKKLAILSQVFGEEIDAKTYEEAARLAGFEYLVVDSRHYVNDSGASWNYAEKLADWMREKRNLDPRKLLSVDEAVSITGLSRIEISNLESQGSFPKGVKMSRDLTLWHVDEVDDWIRENL